MIKKISILLLFLLSLEVCGQTETSNAITKNFLLGNFNYREDPAFVKVSNEHASKVLYLNEIVYTAFVAMFESAKEEGIDLRIVSGTRNFEEQKNIWERKWKSYKNLDPLSRARKILEFSSMPATSRHHWGTDIDLNNLENSYFEAGKGKAEYEWLVANAGKYGFHQVYTSQDSGRTGYAEEKWHWSYLPLASLYLEYFNELIDYRDIRGFEGAELAAENQMIAAYVNGISQENSEAKMLPTQPERGVADVEGDENEN